MKTEGDWIVLRLKSNREKSVACFLACKGITSFLPTRKLPAAGHSGKFGPNNSLFPGYLFVNQPRNDMLDLRYIPGSCGMIVFNGKPARISSEKIEQIRRLSASGFEIQRHERLFEGERVLIVKGPLSGIEGEFLRQMNSSRLIVNILTLNQSVSVEIDRDSIKCIDKVRPRPSEGTVAGVPLSKFYTHVLTMAGHAYG